MRGNILNYSIILLLGVYTLFLWGSGNLGLYIHPRYFGLSFLAGIVCTGTSILGICHTLFTSYHHRSHAHPMEFKYSTVTMLGLLAVLMILPPSQLSARSAGQRLGDSTLNLDYENDTPPIIQSFITNYDTYDVADWVRVLSSESNIERFIDRKVNLQGFIFHPAHFPEDTFLLSRFVVRCCVVDASPIGIPVKLVEWQTSWNESDWLKVSGVFTLESLAGVPSLVVIPEAIEDIEPPSSPYVY